MLKSFKDRQNIQKYLTPKRILTNRWNIYSISRLCVANVILTLQYTDLCKNTAIHQNYWLERDFEVFPQNSFSHRYLGTEINLAIFYKQTYQFVALFPIFGCALMNKWFAYKVNWIVLGRYENMSKRKSNLFNRWCRKIF